MTAKELRRLMPQDSHDHLRAREFVSLGPDVLAPVAMEMLRRMKDESSPVALVYAEFFAASGEVLATEVAHFLSQPGSEYQKYMLVGQVLEKWSRESVSKCTGPLQQIATTNSGVFDTDLRSIQLLAKHDLVDREWLRAWLEFKRAALGRLTEFLEEIATEL